MTTISDDDDDDEERWQRRTDDQRYNDNKADDLANLFIVRSSLLG